MWEELLSPAAPYLFSFFGTLIVLVLLWLWSRGDLANLREDLNRLGSTVETLAQARGPVLANGEAVDVLEIAHQLKQLERNIEKHEGWLRGIAGSLGKLHGLPIDQVEEDGKDTLKLTPLERAWLRAIEEGRAETSLEFGEQPMSFGGMQVKGKGSIRIQPSQQVKESKPQRVEAEVVEKDIFAETETETPRSTGRRARG